MTDEEVAAIDAAGVKSPPVTFRSVKERLFNLVYCCPLNILLSFACKGFLLRCRCRRCWRIWCFMMVLSQWEIRISRINSCHPAFLFFTSERNKWKKKKKKTKRMHSSKCKNYIHDQSTDSYIIHKRKDGCLYYKVMRALNCEATASGSWAVVVCLFDSWRVLRSWAIWFSWDSIRAMAFCEVRAIWV